METINSEITWTLIDFILNSLGYGFILFGMFILTPYILYDIFKHIKKYGIKEKLKSNNALKGSNPIFALFVTTFSLMGGISFFILDGKLMEYLDNATKYLNNL